jgi:hypothetical protein
MIAHYPSCPFYSSLSSVFLPNYESPQHNLHTSRVHSFHLAYPIPPDADEFALTRESRFCSSSSAAESRAMGLYSAITGWLGSGRLKAAIIRLGGTRNCRSSPLWVLYTDRLLASECMRFSAGSTADVVPDGVCQLEGGVGGVGRGPSVLLRRDRVRSSGLEASVGDKGLGGVRLLASGLGRAGAWLKARAASVGTGSAVLASVSTTSSH